MDQDRFDRLTRAFVSRRKSLALTLFALIGGGAIAGTDAKKKCKPPKKRCGAKCVAVKTDRNNCGSCNKKCAAGQTCANGRCGVACPSGQKPCRGACLSVLVCCDAADCAGGRTCQDGTCACPADKPHVCPGGTVCKQCCAKADCAADPDLTGPGIPECASDGTCTCGSGTRYCPGAGRCGTCCNAGECGREQLCYNWDMDAAIICQCPPFEIPCTAVGRTGCLDEQCGACNAPCNPEDGDAACPCPDLVCDFENGTQGPYRCTPR